MTNLNGYHPDVYRKAWFFAAKQHKGQRYATEATGEFLPYVVHVGQVAMETAWAMGQSQQRYDADLAMQCALLHDVLEDTACTYETLAEAFGTAVADGVLALTKNEDLPTKREQMLDSLARIRQQPDEVWLVKMADRICNLGSPPSHWTAAKVAAYRDEAQLILDALGACHELMASRLAEKIAAYPPCSA